MGDLELSAAEFQALYERPRGLGQWGSDDRRGALNHITSDHLVMNVHGDWSFLCVVAPLRLPGGTGSPINPIAIL
jgi:hypothetical protein